MYRFVLTLLIGLMLSLGGGVSAFAKGEVIWEGTQESKLFSLTGPKKIRITTEGVFINGRFKPAWQLSKDDACLYGLSNFPNEGYIGPSEAWKAVLIKFDFHSCHSIRMQARHSFKFSAGSQSESNYVQPVTRKEKKEAFDAAKSKNFAKAKAIWERGHQNGNDEATRNLGVMYANGDGVKKDLNKAFEYYSKASEAGNLQATFDVMHYLYNGKGTAKDIPEMARLIEDTYKLNPDYLRLASKLYTLSNNNFKSSLFLSDYYVLLGSVDLAIEVIENSLRSKEINNIQRKILSSKKQRIICENPRRLEPMYGEKDCY